MARPIHRAFFFTYFVISSLIQLVPSSETYHICDDKELLDASFYMLPNFRNDDVTKIAKLRVDTKGVHVHGEKNCTRSRSRDEDIKCPVYYELNMNPMRKPALLLEARCSCHNAGRFSMDACSPDFYYREVLEYDPSEKCYRRIIRRFRAGCSSKISSSNHR